ncbi:MAG TPA: sterol desaturase family protein [Microthrixaceae bacterium]|nr:sterol desaturase family protein [Microthrixaceae bacterium]
MSTGLTLVAAGFVAGAFWWFLFEYVLHRWAFHAMRGVGIGSREHLEHHVKASWSFDWLLGLVWFGIALTGVAWGVAAGLLTQAAIGWGVGLGWALAYYFYEWHHRAAHLRGPRNGWEAWLRKHHFQHHFGHPMMNQGVTIPLWDIVFRTRSRPERVRVPRRLAMPWLIDEHGGVRPEYAADYEVVGTERAGERQEQIDRARAFANLTPVS